MKHDELTPACPHCESNNVTPMGNGDYFCESCHTHIDAFTWESKTSTGYPSPSDDTSLLDDHYIMQSVSEEVFPDDIETAKEVH